MVRQLKTKGVVVSDGEKVYKNDEELLNEVVPRYVKNKKQMDKLKKSCDEDNKIIKKVLLNKKTDSFSAGKSSVSISSYEKVSFDENALVNVLDDLGVKGIVKTQRYVDLQALEQAILDKKVNAKDISKCQIIKTIVNLNVK